MRDTIPRWQEILSQGFSSSTQLLAFLQLPNEDVTCAEQIFKTRVPRGFAERMEKGNRQDPLLLQVLASESELDIVPGFELDPLREAKVNPIEGLIHKYHGRVLLTVTGACAVNCRYCFRRHFPYQDNNPGRDGWDDVLEYISAEPSIHEVIFSGGDPLLANDLVLSYLFERLEKIEHVTTLRIHTRIPIVLPERIQEGFLGLCQKSRFKIVIVLHSNHPNELDENVAAVCQALRLAGCHLLNQSVLLKNVNADPNILVALSERLFACGVLPYYLHILDKVQGAHGFEIALQDALEIWYDIHSRLPGYLVPRLAREEPNLPYKRIIA